MTRMISRRRFLGAILASAVAPSIVRASSLMPVKAYRLPYVHEILHEITGGMMCTYVDDVMVLKQPCANDGRDYFVQYTVSNVKGISIGDINIDLAFDPIILTLPGRAPIEMGPVAAWTR